MSYVIDNLNSMTHCRQSKCKCSANTYVDNLNAMSGMKRFVELVLNLTGKPSMTRYVTHDVVLT
jgi:hypothetical protein